MYRQHDCMGTAPRVFNIEQQTRIVDFRSQFILFHHLIIHSSSFEIRYCWKQLKPRPIDKSEHSKFGVLGLGPALGVKTSIIKRFFLAWRLGLIDRLLICFVFSDREPSDKSKSSDKSEHSKFGVLGLGPALGVTTPIIKRFFLAWQLGLIERLFALLYLFG